MFALHRIATRPAAQHGLRFPRRNQLGVSQTITKPRTFVSGAIQTASEGFLDLALALPFPEALPPYSGTIILVTALSRLITVPFSLWAKRRQWRTEDVVLPQLLEERPLIFKRVHEEMKSDGFKGTREEAMKEHAKRAQPMLKARQKELCREHKCTVLPTMLIPPVSQLPIFVGISMVLGRASIPPSVLDSEAFLTLTSLTHGDPTLTLPIILGVVTFANVDATRFFVTPERAAREQRQEEHNAKKRAAGETVYQPRKIFQNTLRLAAVGRILIAALVPGSIQLYWVTSAVFGLFQTWAIEWWDHRRRLARSLQRQAVVAASVAPASTIVTQKVIKHKSKERS
ncbi:60Kd inner membrane protein-domain-containing protein [Irpex rosettiformis]|uniref:60Kd inner membrane protein-domain-containing protein n=1 Tax=Irpex rosettiformis TaxID=378272 RepID=A0ACB8UCN6_9APHY|nr:60Kd inner membrane protein-domain-containing protein [Irpex rosettiformis]